MSPIAFESERQTIDQKRVLVASRTKRAADVSMRILIYGAGAIGSIFAGKMFKHGFNMTLLARNKRYLELKKNGLILKNPNTAKEELYHINVINELAENDIFDYIIVVVQFTQIDEILPVLSKNKSPNIVFVVNNPCGYQNWIDAVGYERILLGFPSAGGERVEGKVNYFIFTGFAKLLQSTTFGELNGKKTERLKTLVKIFRESGFSPAICSNMDAWQKTHVAFIIPICKALYKFNSDNYKLAKSYKTLKMMILFIRECFKVLKYHKIPVTPRKLYLFYLPTFILTPIFMIIMNTKMAEVALARHAIVAKQEVEALREAFEKLTIESGIETPILNWFK